MKILIATVLLGALGAGSLHYSKAAGAAPAPKCDAACEATLSCTPEGNCRIQCTDANGASCSVEIACDGENCQIVGCQGPDECAKACTPHSKPVCPAGCR